MTSSIEEHENLSAPGSFRARLCWKAAHGLLRAGEGIGTPAVLSSLGESAICDPASGCGKLAYFSDYEKFDPPRGCLGPGDEEAAISSTATVPYPRKGE